MIGKKTNKINLSLKKIFVILIFFVIFQYVPQFYRTWTCLTVVRNLFIYYGVWFCWKEKNKLLTNELIAVGLMSDGTNRNIF